ncbi:hypothetical protein KC19_VG202700 [Ceratodon purpureus]|uniref:Uncharacterized protein n=1 Tax=Ceratodon purpureus TaxID=3225 RepID=A0A8T0HSD1_CERPU|nr:hypothetical protein KC19_VG202700 [Ceratodon purpureus]
MKLKHYSDPESNIQMADRIHKQGQLFFPLFVLLFLCFTNVISHPFTIRSDTDPTVYLHTSIAHTRNRSRKMPLCTHLQQTDRTCKDNGHKKSSATNPQMQIKATTSEEANKVQHHHISSKAHQGNQHQHQETPEQPPQHQATPTQPLQH